MGSLHSMFVQSLPGQLRLCTPQEAAALVRSEYGARNLRGMTLRERAQALIEIAHPDSREALTEAARGRHLLA